MANNFNVREMQFEWKIHNLFHLQELNKNGRQSRSHEFRLCNCKYLMSIYPNGDRECNIGWVSLYLLCVEGYGDCVSCSFSIKCGNSLIEEDSLSHTFSEIEGGFGFPKFILRSELSNILKLSPHNDLTVQCTVKSEGSEYDKLQTSSYRGIENLLQNFETLFLEGHESDIKFNVQGREIEAHKLILEARSSVFAAMFKSEMLESSSGVVEIPDMSPELFKDFLHFVYTGKFSCVTPQNALGLYKAGVKYAFLDLKVECLKKITSKNGLSVNTVFDVISAAVEFDEKLLFAAASKYCITNAEEVFSMNEWKTFFIENTQIANKLIIKMAKSGKPDSEYNEY